MGRSIETPESVKEFLINFRKNPGSLWVLLALIGIGFFLLIGGVEQNTQRQNTAQVTVEDRAPSLTGEERLEAELTKTLERITGKGSVRVDLNLKAGNRRVWERQARVNKRVLQEEGSLNTEESSSDELVFAKDRDGRDNPILKEELAPEIEGVVIVVSGAESGRIRELLTDTVITILGLPAHRVMVIPGVKEEVIE